MGALNDLGVAAGAAQVLAATHLTQVVGMIESNPRVVDLTLELPLRMTAGSQAGGVLDLRPGLDAVGACDVLHDLVGGLDLAHRLGFDAGRVVALDALHRVVGGAGPGIVVGLHDVAVSAEAGLAAVLDEPDRADRSQDDQEDPHLDRDLQRT